MKSIISASEVYYFGKEIAKLFPPEGRTAGRRQQNLSKLPPVRGCIDTELNENMLSQESQKMYLECRVASNPSVLVFGRLNQAPDQATTCSPCEKFAF